MPSRGQAGWKSRAKKFAELLGSDDMLKAEVVPVEAPTWDTLQSKPTNLATTESVNSAIAAATPSWSSLTGKPTDLATTGNVAAAKSEAIAAASADATNKANTAQTNATNAIPANIVTHDGSGNVTLAGDLTARDVVIT